MQNTLTTLVHKRHRESTQSRTLGNLTNTHLHGARVRGGCEHLDRLGVGSVVTAEQRRRQRLQAGAVLGEHALLVLLLMLL